MKRPTIIKKLPEFAFLTVLVGLFGVAAGIFAIAVPGEPVGVLAIVAGLGMWAISILFYAVDYCCRCLEEISQAKAVNSAKTGSGVRQPS